MFVFITIIGLIRWKYLQLFHTIVLWRDEIHFEYVSKGRKRWYYNFETWADKEFLDSKEKEKKKNEIKNYFRSNIISIQQQTPPFE